MPSNQYSGSPKVCLLCTTGSGRAIDLLNASGICITNPPGWIPAISQLKSGGVRVGSQSLNDDWVVAGGYEPVTETFPITIDPVDTDARVQDLLNRLWDAEQFWLEGWQRGAVYLKVQLTEDAGIRYSRIKIGAYQIGTYAYGGRSGLPDNTLILEREPFWYSEPPGEMIGPFRNMAKNASFEVWDEHGIIDQIPTGWDEQTDANFPANPELSREEHQIIAPAYALRMEFTGAGGAAPNEWYVWQWTKLEVDQDYTIRVWLNLTMGGGVGETFFIRVIDDLGATLHNETFTTSQNGWYYLNFTTGRAWLYTALEIGFTAPATSVGSTAIVDHLMLTEGAWDEDTWPGDFYMSSSVVWSSFTPPCYDFVPAPAIAYPYHRNTTVDVMGLPGDVDAEARIALEMAPPENVTTSTIPYVSAQKVALFAEKNIGPGRSMVHINTPGMWDSSDETIGDAEISYTIPQDAQRELYSRQFNGDEITMLLNHDFKLFVRVRTEKDSEIQVKYWIGDPSQDIELDPESITGGTEHHLVLATPKGAISWRSMASDRVPASVGFSIYVENVEGDGTSLTLLDAAWLLPVDNGGAWVEDVIASGQSLTLDSSSLSKPVQKAYTVMRAALDRPTGPSGATLLCTAAQTYNEKLYAFYLGGGGVSSEYAFDGSTWAAAITYAGQYIMSTEVMDAFMWMGASNGNFYYYDSNTDTTTLLYLVPGGFPIYDMVAFGPDIYLTSDADIRQCNRGGTAIVMTRALHEALCVACYKHQVWAGWDSGLTAYWTIAGGQVNGPTLPCTDDVIDMIEFQDRLYILCRDGDVYYWDGSALTLSRTGVPATDGYGQKLEVFNNDLYLLTAWHATSNVSCLFKTEDGITWTEVLGFVASHISDGGELEVFAGRLCVFPGTGTGGLFGCVWHAPLIATISIPDHTGSAITLIPEDLTRLHVLYETREDNFHVDLDLTDYTAGIKLWVSPRWRALRKE